MWWRIQALVTLMVIVGSCNRDLSDDPIPVIYFPNSTINLFLPEYSALAVDGGFKTVSSIAGTTVGVRGIILYRKDKSSYIAYEVNCSYHPNEAGSNVGVHPSGLFMACAGCGSNFSFSDGSPTGGVAWRPLRKYRTELSNNSLTITNELAN